MLWVQQCVTPLAILHQMLPSHTTHHAHCVLKNLFVLQLIIEGYQGVLNCSGRPAELLLVPPQWHCCYNDASQLLVLQLAYHIGIVANMLCVLLQVVLLLLVTIQYYIAME